MKRGRPSGGGRGGDGGQKKMKGLQDGIDPTSGYEEVDESVGSPGYTKEMRGKIKVSYRRRRERLPHLFLPIIITSF